MRDIWNPWHGCIKCSEGCQNCYMYYLDAQRGRDGSRIARAKTGFRYPLAKDRSGRYKVGSGEMLRVCLTSDFFLAEADEWRGEAWEIIRQRPDVKFFLLTKRPERAADHLPEGWGDGWENVMLSVSCENQRRTDERVPVLLSLPFKHKGIMCAPLIGPVSLRDWLSAGQIEEVLCDGENYEGARPCRYEWVRTLSEECAGAGVTFVFCGTGRRFLKDGKLFRIESRALQRSQAVKSGLSFRGAPIRFDLCDGLGNPIPEVRPFFAPRCETCGKRPVCGGCSRCGRCGYSPREDEN